MNKNISQIFLTHESQELPKFIQQACSSIKNKFKDHNIVIYNNDSLYQFIDENYDQEILNVYKKIIPLAYKADLGRYCLLYKLGGWYFDIAIKCLRSLDVKKGTDLICFRDEQRHSKTSWAVCNGIFWAKKENKILSTCIDQILKNYKSKWYGRTPLCPTGPALFGEAIAKENRSQNIIFGDLVRPNIPFTRKNIPYLRKIFQSKFYLNNGTAFALVKPTEGGDLTTLGVKGSDNYNKYWNSKMIYKK
tara:strand:+ start:1726 stop:2469 length:744 start_codon:yes stop_codon:yes gene_type:complete